MSSDGDVKRPASNLLVCVATAREADGLPHVIAGRTIDIVETGVGPVNAAIALTRVLAAATPATIVSLGIGGAYPGAGLTPGDVVCATSERYGDLGAESPEGFLDMAALGFPIVQKAVWRLGSSHFPSRCHS
jgi:futalosine hydrolase